MTGNKPGWTAAGKPDEIAAHFERFAPDARALIAAPARWQKWALFDRRPGPSAAQDRVTLIGDAAHPMLPFLAQGGALAIEDAAVLAQCFARDEETRAALVRTGANAVVSRRSSAKPGATPRATILQVSAPSLET